MKRREESYRHKSTFGSRYYLDEIETIIEMMIESGHDVKLSDSKYEYEDLDEVVDQNPYGLYNLEIEGKYSNSMRSVQVRFNRPNTSISTWNSNPETVALFHKLSEFLVKGNWGYFLLMIGIILLGLSALSITGIINSIASGRQLQTVNPNAALRLVAITLIGLMIIYRYFIVKPIVMKHRRKAQGFLARNADDIWKYVIGAIIGIIGTIVTTYILGLFS